MQTGANMNLRRGVRAAARVEATGRAAFHRAVRRRRARRRREQALEAAEPRQRARRAALGTTSATAPPPEGPRDRVERSTTAALRAGPAEAAADRATAAPW